MRRWFLSYHSPDQALAERLKVAIERNDESASRVFFAPTHLRAGGSWSAQLAEEIADATAFILLVGEAGIGKWQVPGYDEALDKWGEWGRTFPLIVCLAEGQAGPAFSAPTALDHPSRSCVQQGHRAPVRRGVRGWLQPRRIMALHVSLSRP